MDNPGTEMGSNQWKFPRAARFDKIVAKDKILKQTPASPGEKKRFRQQIKKVRCSHEITAASMNIDSSPKVPKLLIIQLASNIPEPDVKVISAVDRAFGVPVFFEINHNNKFRYAACLRRRSRSDQGPWSFGSYFFGPWMDKHADLCPLPLALPLEILYEKLLQNLVPLQPRKDESFACLIDRWEAIQHLTCETAKLEARIQKEKQFNHKVDLNRRLNLLKKQMENICNGICTHREGLK